MFDLERLWVVPSAFAVLSVGTWTHRKNMEGLCLAYLAEFQRGENIVLILRSYGQDNIDSLVGSVVRGMRLKDPARIVVIDKAMSFTDLVGLYRRADLYAAPHRGEGWGLPISESMLCGTPAAVTDWSGSTSFCNAANSYPLEYSMVPVHSMPWIPWYDGRQSWAEPRLDRFREVMRRLFDAASGVLIPSEPAIREHHNKATAATQAIRQFSPQIVGGLMRAHLESIL
jgi:hypothetical protein